MDLNISDEVAGIKKLAIPSKTPLGVVNRYEQYHEGETKK
jgi:hypothetical protein